MLPLAACSGHDGAEGGNPHRKVVEGQAEPVKEFLDAQGRRFTLMGPAETTLREPGSMTVVHEQGAAAEPRPPTLEELAEQIRPVTVRNGYQYHLAEPDYATAAKILDKNNPAPRTEPGPAREGRTVFGGTDDRQYVDGMAWPIAFTEIGCTGNLIGRSTLITAAHCVFNTDNDTWYTVPAGGGASRYPNWAMNMDGRDTNPTPFGWLSCFDPFITQGWVDLPSESTAGGTLYDYAVVEFGDRCGSHPGDQSSWSGTNPATEATIEANLTEIIGYPQAALGVIRAPGNPPIQKAEAWGMSAPAGTTYIDSPATSLKYTIDTSPGQSGSGIRGPFNGQLYIIGIHRGDGGAGYNVGRRWDTTVFNFVDAASASFP